MADLAFIVVAHVHHDGISAFRQLVESRRIQVLPPVRHVKGGIIQAICDNFFAHLDRQLVK